MDLPDSNPKTRFGVAKPGVADIPPVATLVLGQGMTNGKEKYGRTNWREHEVTASVYYNAMNRHLMSWWDGEECAADSGVHHLGHAMACAAILVDAQETGKLIDDRPSVPGTTADFIARMTTPMNEIPEGQRGPAAPEALNASATITHGEAEDTRIEREARSYAEEVALRVLSTSRLEDATNIILAMCFDPEEAEEIEEEDEITPTGLQIEITEPTNLQTYVIGIDTEEPPAAVQAKVSRFLRNPDNLARLNPAFRHIGREAIGHMNRNQRTRLSFYIDCLGLGLTYGFDDLDSLLINVGAIEEID